MVPALNTRGKWLLFSYISRCRTGTSTTTYKYYSTDKFILQVFYSTPPAFPEHPSVITVLSFSVGAEKLFEYFNTSHMRDLTVMNALPMTRLWHPVVMFTLPSADHRLNIGGWSVEYCSLRPIKTTVKPFPIGRIRRIFVIIFSYFFAYRFTLYVLSHFRRLHPRQEESSMFALFYRTAYICMCRT